MAGATIGPVLPRISEAFHHVPNAELLTRLVLTMPALFIVLSSTGCGYLVDRFGRKKLLIAGIILYGFSGTAGAWLDSLAAILASRALLGISVAAVMTVCITLIGDYYHNAERRHVMGLQSAFMAFGGVFFISAGGFLADISWRAPFLIYALALLLLPGIMLFIHEPEREYRTGGPEKMKPGEKSAPLPIIALIVGAAFFGMAMFYMIPVHIPYLLNQFGDISSTQTGLALSSFVLMGAIVALNYHRFVNRMTYPSVYLLCFFLLGTGYMLISGASSYPHIFGGLILGGLGSGLLMPNSNIWLLSEAPEHLRGRFSGMVTTAVFLGQFLSPILTQPLVDAFSIATGFFVIGLFVTGLVVLLILVYFTKRTHHRKA